MTAPPPLPRDPRIEVGSVVQINDRISRVGWVGAFLIVTEVREWGVMGFVPMVANLDEPAGRAYLRPKWEQVEYIGEALFAPEGEPK